MEGEAETKRGEDEDLIIGKDARQVFVAIYEELVLPKFFFD